VTFCRIADPSSSRSRRRRLGWRERREFRRKGYYLRRPPKASRKRLGDMDRYERKAAVRYYRTVLFVVLGLSVLLCLVAFGVVVVNS